MEAPSEVQRTMTNYELSQLFTGVTSMTSMENTCANTSLKHAAKAYLKCSLGLHGPRYAIICSIKVFMLKKALDSLLLIVYLIFDRPTATKTAQIRTRGVSSSTGTRGRTETWAYSQTFHVPMELGTL